MMRAYHILDTVPGALGCSASGCSVALPSSHFRLRDMASDSSDGDSPKVPPHLSTHPGLCPVYAESFCSLEPRGVGTTRLSLYKRAQGTKKRVTYWGHGCHRAEPEQESRSFQDHPRSLSPWGTVPQHLPTGREIDALLLQGLKRVGTQQ